KRLTRTTMRDSIYSADVVLTRRRAQPLAAVRVEAARPTPVRFDDERFGAGVGAAEQLATGLAAGVSPDRRGGLDALAATLPGVTLTAQGTSVLGLSSDQNARTLNGLSFPSARLPAELRSSATVTTSTYDPSRGWFGGAETRITVESGGPYSRRTASLSG